MLPETRRKDKHVGGKEAAWTVQRRKSQEGLGQGRDTREGPCTCPWGDQFSSVQPLSCVRLFATP